MTWTRRDAEPYQPGNFAALKHGARSPRKIAEEAERVHAALLDVAPWCDEPQYAPTLQRYLQAAAREQLAHQAYMSNPTSRLLESATAAARLAWQMGDALGLTPAGHARLKAITAAAVGAEVNLQEVIERGRRRRLDAEARMAGELPAGAESTSVDSPSHPMVTPSNWPAAGAESTTVDDDRLDTPAERQERL